MNHKTIISLLPLLLCIGHYCFGAAGCMDNSWHLTKAYDYKELHYVTTSDGGYCKCPCDKHIAEYGKQVPRGRCPVCKHYRVPQSVIIINNALQEYKEYQHTHNGEFKRIKKYENPKTKIGSKQGIKNALSALRKLTTHPKAIVMR